MNKRIETVPTETMEALTRYHWPGNVRELENLTKIQKLEISRSL